MKKQIRLKNLIKEEKLNEGIITSALTNLINFLLSSKVKQIDNLIDPKSRREVAAYATKLKTSVEKYNEHLRKPEVKRSIEKLGGNIEDYFIKDI